jgi:hypothetical protein
MDTTRTLVSDAVGKEAEGGSHEEKRSRKARKTSTPARNGGGARYFLSAESSPNDSPLALGEEFQSEDEVLVASFQKGVLFYSVETWKTHAEKKGRNMVLRKQS